MFKQYFPSQSLMLLCSGSGSLFSWGHAYMHVLQGIDKGLAEYFISKNKMSDA